MDPNSDVAATRPAVQPATPYLWMLFGAFAFAVMSTLAHSIRDRFSWPAIAIGRSSVPFVLTALSAIIAGGKLVVFGSRALWLRSLAGSTSLVLTFFALTRLPVADALTLTNLFPIWVALLSWPMLHQRPDSFAWGCVVFAIAGVILIQQPHLESGNLATLTALCASLTSAIAMLGLHRVRGLDTRAIVWHFSGVSLIFGCTALWVSGAQPLNLGAGTHSGAPTALNWLCLVGVGFWATLGQFGLTKAFTLGVPSRVSVIGLTQVGFAVVFEILWEHRQYNRLTVVGMLLVLAPTAWLLFRWRDGHSEDTSSISEAG